ncbi:MAG: alpha/beta hydrolase [Deltaproteobacteria bacterium]|nr:MAG: alpha/beta hydrolase [Deltaproteobacteria bacterium]
MLILFAHGAGAGSSSEWMQSWAARLGELGRVVPFDYPYMAAGKKAPNRLPQLIEAHREVLRRERREGEKVVLAGKSMGSRVGCHLSLEEPVDALVCLGYPLVGMGKKRAVRDQVLVDLRTPVLFVQGTRDNLCPLDTLAEVRERMTAPSSLHVVDTGNHSLQVTKGWMKQTGLTQEDADVSALAAIREFLA